MPTLSLYGQPTDYNNGANLQPLFNNAGVAAANAFNSQQYQPVMINGTDYAGLLGGGVPQQQPQQVFQPLGQTQGGVSAFPQTAGISQTINPQILAQIANQVVGTVPRTPQGAVNGGITNNPMGNGQTADQFLASIAQNYNTIANRMLTNNGQPFNAEPTWDAMVAAMRRGQQRGAADLNEFFNVGGGRFSQNFGTGMADYYSQSQLDQNSILAQLTMAAHESAANRQMQGYQALLGGGLNAAGQLSGQGFQSQMAQRAQALAAAQQQSQLAAGAGQQISANSNTAAMQAIANAMQGAGALFGQENAALAALFGNQNTNLMALLGQEAQQQALMAQLGLGLGSLSNQNLQLGAQLGQLQYQTQQDIINRVYQEWLRTQPVYNPLLGYMFGGATSYAPTTTTQTPGFWDYFSQIVSGIGGGLVGGLVGRR